MRCYHCQKEVKEEEIEYFMETTKTSLNILNNSRGNTDEHISGLEGFMNELVLSSSGRSSSSDQFCLHPSHHLSLNTSLRLAQQHRLRGDVLSAIRLTRTNLEAMSGWLIIVLYLVHSLSCFYDQRCIPPTSQRWQMLGSCKLTSLQPSSPPRPDYHQKPRENSPRRGWSV